LGKTEENDQSSKTLLLKELPPGRALGLKSCHFGKEVGGRNTLPLCISKTTWASPGENNYI